MSNQQSNLQNEVVGINQSTETKLVANVAKLCYSIMVPGNPIPVTYMFTILMSLINIGSTVAFNAVLSLSVLALMANYAISIDYILLRRLQGEPFPPARWSLGRAGMPVNTVSLICTVWAFFRSFWPIGFEPTVLTFNWAVVLFVGVIGIACLVYHLHA